MTVAMSPAAVGVGTHTFLDNVHSELFFLLFLLGYKAALNIAPW